MTETKYDKTCAKSFGHAVRNARHELGLSINELARKLQLKAPITALTKSISKIETQGATPGNRYFFYLCDALGIDPSVYPFQSPGYTGLIRLYKNKPLTVAERIDSEKILRQNTKYIDSDFLCELAIRLDIGRFINGKFFFWEN